MWMFQLQSFEAEISIPDVAAKEGGPPIFRGVFIRAPGILEIGPEVEVLAEVPAPPNGAAKSSSAVETLEVTIWISLIILFNFK